jgi:2-polyprenyl-3-methyl-5-hydroxy-6-metoxy-1,4-benzoquinol methylase
MSRYARPLDLSELNAHTQGILLVPPGSDVLDVGTADGHPVVEGLRARGCRVWGVEIDEQAAAEAAELCESMTVGNVEHLDLTETFGDRRFDVVLCLDVLEHLVEPLDTLVRLKDLLTPTGTVVASIPNVTHAAVRLQLLDGAFTYTDTGLLDRTHVRFFDREEVERLFTDAGLTITERLEVRREPHETEIPIDLEKVPAEALEAVKADPDSRVFQWVVVAKRAVETTAEVPTTGVATALLAEVTRLEGGIRSSADHVAWLEGMLADRDELHTRAVTANELGDAHEQVRALSSSLEVKDAYIAHLQASLGLASDTPQVVPARAAVVHKAVDKAVERLDQHPGAARAARAGLRVTRKIARRG